MVSVTASAAQQIRIAAADSGAEGMSLRVAAHYDEAADELQYGIGFDEAHTDDLSFESSGISVLVSPLSEEAVQDLVIDFVELSPGDFRFIFYRAGDVVDPPQGSSSCGGCSCGSAGAGGSGSCAS
jgi:iron-sulfur cluster assembly protein